MKKILIIAISILTSTGSFAQLQNKQVTISDLKMNVIKSDLTVDFKAFIGSNVVKSSYTLEITPEMVNGDSRADLPSIIVQGRLAKISANREKYVTAVANLVSIYTADNSVIEYSAIIPYQSWMEGSTVRIKRISSGCCSISLPEFTVLAENIVLIPPIIVAEKPAEPIKSIETVGDMVAKQHSFVIPFDKYTGKFDDDDRGMTIYFKQAISVIEPMFRDNDSRLKEVLAAIRAIDRSNDSRIAKIVIGGFASPEGTLTFNEKLGRDRAKAFKDFIMNNSRMNGNSIEVHNGGEDWAGLKKMVEESDMYDKYRVLRIIDEVPIWDEQSKRAREAQLKSLNGGETYNYMLHNFFPDLRNAAYIKIYYENITK